MFGFILPNANFDFGGVAQTWSRLPKRYCSVSLGLGFTHMSAIGRMLMLSVKRQVLIESPVWIVSVIVWVATIRAALTVVDI